MLQNVNFNNINSSTYEVAEAWFNFKYDAKTLGSQGVNRKIEVHHRLYKFIYGEC